MIGHLGSRVSALLDGQLTPAETERAWEHVHACHVCRDAVEHEGWIKSRLARLTLDPGDAPGRLKGALHPDAFPHVPSPASAQGGDRSRTALMVWGSGALGAAVVGIVALGVAPADRPPAERRTPVTSLVTYGPRPVNGPVDSSVGGSADGPASPVPTRTWVAGRDEEKMEP